MIKEVIKRIKLVTIQLTPKLHILPQVIYIKWLGYEWMIRR